MATLQKFKLLATQCAVAGSPTRSPSASPVIHLRRRKTLRMLLSRGGNGSRRLSRGEEDSLDRLRNNERNSREKGKELAVSQKLRDLFVSSPPQFDERVSENVRDGMLSRGVDAAGGGGAGLRRFGGNRSLRPLSATFRQRLLRRAWRPVLVAIPE
ncbi:OLC1v1010717C1 [Oldenlandia corymbosa var. corymbosa]|uniref:OLC1v1010717C1 n=1 Tax=Oldenlandia corymbosa var. corymbosa TaxID=529605 RepID=A0AAV1DV01_OLDCO|nr:OLC1v1010717C1 [Oldenlandia corymbosa var. corymbosa]